MNAQQLHDALKKIQEPKGCYFNADASMTMALMESLLVNKERLGYMAWRAGWRTAPWRPTGTSCAPASTARRTCGSSGLVFAGCT